MRIKLVYFDGCPSYEEALRNLREAIAEEKLDTIVELITVTSPEQAERLKFLGSPTIQIDDVDLEGPEAVNSGVGYGCRVYEDVGQMRGWPSKEQIRAALRDRFRKAVQPSPAPCRCHGASKGTWRNLRASFPLRCSFPLDQFEKSGGLPQWKRNLIS